MKRTGSFLFSAKSFLIWSFVAILLAGGVIAVAIQSPAVKAQGGDAPVDGETGQVGRFTGNADYEHFAKADAVTKVVRDRSQSIFSVKINNIADRAAAAKLGTIVEDYGSFVIVSSGKKGNVERSGLEAAKLSTTVNLPGKTFEPLTSAPVSGLRGAEAGSGKNYYVVQFAGTIKGEWMESLCSQGIEFLQYLPQNAYYIYADGDQVQKALNHSRVRWVGSITPEAKLSTTLTDQLSAARGKTQPRNNVSPLEMTGPNTAVFDVAIFSRADADAVAASVANIGTVKSIAVLPNNYLNMLRVELPLDKVMDVLNIPDVITIDAHGTPQLEDERAGQILAGNYTNTTTLTGPGYNPLSQFGVDGTNVTVSVGDDGISIPGNGGFYLTTANTIDGPLRGATAGASGGHGHINASIIAGSTPFGVLDPLGYIYGLGIAPKANIVNIPFLKSGNTTTDLQLFEDTINTVGPNGVKGSISNNSWGNGTNANVYDAYTSTYDGFVRDASSAATVDPVVIVFSAGNSGTSGLTRPKTSKNTIAVANSENLRTELSSSANNIDDINSTSSRGLAADGRVKPDVSAPGTVITGSRAGDCTSVSSCFDTNHAWSSGTSHAAPQIAGAAALFTQYWKNTHSGVYPSPAIVKAAIVQTGQEMNGVGSTAVVPNGAEGWGRANMKYMLNTGVGMKYEDQTTTFSNVGESVVYSGTVADASKPVRVTLVWTDPPGAANANPALVNNLDLSVTVSANTYKGNFFLSGLSTTGGSADVRNNVENVWLPAGIAAGTPFSVTVSATAINGDGVLGNADITDQNFALVAYNYQAAAQPVSRARADFDGDGKTDISVFRPSTGVWYALRSSDATVSTYTFGQSGDVITPGDYDADGKTDYAVFRPSTGVWYVQRSTAGFAGASFGQAGDIPVQDDYDNDGKADYALWRPSTGVFYTLRSTAGFTGYTLGVSSDIPVHGDFDGVGGADFGVFRPSTGYWYVVTPSGVATTPWGSNGDKPAPADYDGDGKVDLAIYRPSEGNWYVLRSTTGFNAFAFGISTDLPAPGDYDGDGKSDAGIFRTGTWYTLRSTAGIGGASFGSSGDIAVPAGYIPQ